MNKGFTLLEFTISLSLTLGLLSVLLTTILESSKNFKKESQRQEKLEALFFTIDLIKFDVQNCGSFLQDLEHKLSLIETDQKSYLKLLMGTKLSQLKESAAAGTKSLLLEANHNLKKGDQIFIFDNQRFFSRQIAKVNRAEIILDQTLTENLPPQSYVVATKAVEYRFYKKEKILKRRVNNGIFQPVLENITDFFCSHLKNSNAILYRLEINGKQQVRNFLFLPNLTKSNE